MAERTANDLPGTIQARLEEVHRTHGTPRAIARAQALLDDELHTLEWPPAFGLALIRWALQLSAPPSRQFLETACTYLSLYYQELDDDIARCRALLDTQRESAVEDAHRVLTEALARVEA